MSAGRPPPSLRRRRYVTPTDQLSDLEEFHHHSLRFSAFYFSHENSFLNLFWFVRVYIGSRCSRISSHLNYCINHAQFLFSARSRSDVTFDHCEKKCARLRLEAPQSCFLDFHCTCTVSVFSKAFLLPSCSRLKITGVPRWTHSSLNFIVLQVLKGPVLLPHMARSYRFARTLLDVLSDVIHYFREMNLFMYLFVCFLFICCLNPETCSGAVQLNILTQSLKDLALEVLTA